MTIEIRVPILPESVADATVVTWHKKPGESIKRDENLVDIETDKVVLEVPAPDDGVIKEILKPNGSTVVAQEVLATFEAGALKQQEAKPQSSTAEAEIKLPSPDTSTSGPALNQSAAVALSPSVRRAVAEHNVDPQQVTGTGKEGKITKADVLQVAQQGISGRTEQRVPMSRLRARIAERLVNAQQNAAILTTFNEVNLQAVMDLRSRYKESFEKSHGARLGFMSFFTKAAIAALQRFPAVNASIDGNDIIYHNYCDIGIAVSSERGLVVPILRNAQNMSFAQIEAQIAEFGSKAKSGQLSIEEMTGGTFTLTNGGVFGSLLSTPIINPPQSAILGMHKIEERPVVEKGQIVIRPMMYLALSYDHRLIDGKESVSFLVTIKELLEDPARLLLDV